jgi:hypothetical protein
MFFTQKNITYYLFNCKKNTYERKFDSEEELKLFLKKSFRLNYKDKWVSPYMENINMNGNDTATYIDWDGNYHTCIREFLFVDEDYRIIDVRKYEKELIDDIKKNGPYTYYEEENEEEREYGERLYIRYGRFSYRYRIDPVPWIWNRGGRYRGIRYPKTLNETKLNSDEEMKEYVRGKRRHLPNSYDDIPRRIQKSWKEQSKKRKQWM